MSVKVTGLTANSIYLTGNDIWVRIWESDVFAAPTVSSLTVQVEGINGEYVFYPSPVNDFYLNLSAIVKLGFEAPKHDENYIDPTPYPATTNFIKKKVTFTVSKLGGTQSVNVTSYFLRGYKRTNGTNIKFNFGKFLTNSSKIPVWPGYPSSAYYVPDALNSLPGTAITIHKQINIPNSSREELKVKGCENVYVKFMNSLGGYSYWLFEKNETDNKNKHLGYTKSRQGYSDFGSYGSRSRQLQSKVPSKYSGLMLDLIESPEAYIYNPSATIAADKWQRIILEDNNIPENSWDTLYEVKIDVTVPLKYNPSLIW